MEIAKIRVRPRNSDRKLHTLFYLASDSIELPKLRQHLSSLFPFGYWLDEDKIERRVVDFIYEYDEFFEECKHEYLEKYKTEPIQYYTKEEVNNLDFARSALDAT